MARYTVHVPTRPPVRAEALERAVFVRDGWSWGAFAFGPFWLIWHRHYVTGLALLVFFVSAFVGMRLLPIGDLAQAAIKFLIMLLWGLEGASLRRFALLRGGYSEEALVVGDGLDTIEQRFFADAIGENTDKPAASSDPAPAASLPPASPRNPWGAPVIGLFPDSRKPQ